MREEVGRGEGVELGVRAPGSGPGLPKEQQNRELTNIENNQEMNK